MFEFPDIPQLFFPLSKIFIGTLAVLAFGAWYLSRLIYNVYFHPLRAFPGPKLAAATRWYEGYFDNLVSHGGQYMYEIDRMHEQFGSNILDICFTPYC